MWCPPGRPRPARVSVRVTTRARSVEDQHPQARRRRRAGPDGIESSPWHRRRVNARRPPDTIVTGPTPGAGAGWGAGRRSRPLRWWPHATRETSKPTASRPRTDVVTGTSNSPSGPVIGDSANRGRELSRGGRCRHDFRSPLPVGEPNGQLQLDDGAGAVDFPAGSTDTCARSRLRPAVHPRIGD